MGGERRYLSNRFSAGRSRDVLERMRMHTIRYTMIAMIPALVFACGGGDTGEFEEVPAPGDEENYVSSAVELLEPGMNQDEVRNTLGEPRTRVTMDGGLERWTYYNYDADGRISAKTLLIFGSDGTLVEINDMGQ
jgi:hypothetical protein